ncbi:MAG TPA: BsuPI-related putative proteinase inhibitor [Bacillaceae bacterium]
MIDFSIEVQAGQEAAEFSFIARNNSGTDLVLEFPTSQFFDFTIQDATGKLVYHFGEGMFFLQAFQYATIKKGSEKIWKAKWNYTNGGARVPGGEYRIAAQLLPSAINGERPVQSLSASVEFHIPEA